MVIDVLGIGVADREGGPWLLRRVCARIERPGETIAVVARQRAQREALLDAVAGQRIPDEGRIWVGGVPVMRPTASRIRALVADASPTAALTDRRSLLWNTLSTGRTSLGTLLRMPRPGERAAAMHALSAVGLHDRAPEPVATLSPADRARVVLARAVARRPRVVILRDVGPALGPEASGFLDLARVLARLERFVVLVSTDSVAAARAAAERMLVLAEGLLVFDGPSAEFTDRTASRLALEELA